MTKAKNNVETTVLNILNDSKKLPHKFFVPYLYTVNTEDLDNICVLLLHFNMNVNVIEVTNTISKIEIIHVPSSTETKLKYAISSNNELTDEVCASNLELNNSKMKAEILVSRKNILNMIIFDLD